MTGARAVRLRFASIGAGLVLAGCGGGAAGGAHLSHAATPRVAGNGSAPRTLTVQPNDLQRCTGVYCVPQPVPLGPGKSSAP
jgi:hypothetical protein